jgi:hypothetical protein
MITEQFFIITATLGLLVTLTNLIGANLYDLHEVKKQRQLRLHPYARQYRQRPLVSIVVEVQDQEIMIEACLNSIVRSSYRKYEIIVIDHASRDSSKQLVRQFQAAHASKQLTVVARRNRSASQSALLGLIKKHARGEFIMYLNAAATLDTQAVALGIQQFNLEPAIGTILLNERVKSTLTITGLFQRYQELLRHQSTKLRSLLKIEPVLAAGTALYRREVLLSTRKQRSEPSRAYYASNAVAYTEPVQSLGGLLKQHYLRQRAYVQTLPRQRRAGLRPVVGWFQVVFGLCTMAVAGLVPVWVSYFVYLAFSLHEPTFLVLSWVALAILLLFAVWGDEHLKVIQKALYSLLLPVTYALFYVTSFVTVVATLRSILPAKLLPRSS